MMFVNTVCVDFFGVPIATKSLPVPILHGMPHVMIELGQGEVVDLHACYWNDGRLLCCSEFNAFF